MDINNFVSDFEDEGSFSREDIESCYEKKLDSSKFKNHRSCPKCGNVAEKLIWIEYTSPGWTWKQLCGRQGPLSICPECRITVEFILETMN